MTLSDPEGVSPRLALPACLAATGGAPHSLPVSPSLDLDPLLALSHFACTCVSLSPSAPSFTQRVLSKHRWGLSGDAQVGAPCRTGSLQIPLSLYPLSPGTSLAK